jgi:AP-1 complex subunit beta-1
MGGWSLLCAHIHTLPWKLFFDFLFQIDAVVQKMQQNNVFTIAKRNVEGQDMLYQSLKLTNGIWVLNELKIQPGNPNITVS